MSIRSKNDVGRPKRRYVDAFVEEGMAGGYFGTQLGAVTAK